MFCSEVSLFLRIKEWGIIEGFHTYTPLCCHTVHLLYVVLRTVIRNVMIIVCSPDIPVFPTVTAVITLERYEEVKTETHKFLVPRDYHKVSHHTSIRTFTVCVCVCVCARARARVRVCMSPCVYAVWYICTC